MTDHNRFSNISPVQGSISFFGLGPGLQCFRIRSSLASISPTNAALPSGRPVDGFLRIRSSSACDMAWLTHDAQFPVPIKPGKSLPSESRTLAPLPDCTTQLLQG